MAQSLEQYIAEATNAYKPAQTAIQNQLNALEGNYNTSLNKINSQYALQQESLNKQRNQAAEDASLAAAARGSGFGGQADLANQKYYERTFTPAVTALQTNKANDIDALRQSIENQRTSLNSQLANLEAQANQQALQKYWAEQEAEKNRQAQLAAASASNAGNYIARAQENSSSTAIPQNVDFKTWLNNYSGADAATKKFYNNILNAGLNINSQAVTSGALRKISSTPIYQNYLRATGR